MTRPTLLTIAEAAARLGLPEKPLAKAALTHGFLIKVGAQSRIMESEIMELLEKCRCQPKGQDSSCENDGAGIQLGSLRTRVDTSEARAQEISNRLKGNSRPTSRKRTDATNPQSPRT